MKSHLLKACFLIAVLGTVANAASINFDTGSSRGHLFATASGARLAIGSIVKLGTLDVANQPDSFVEFATTVINNTGGASTVLGFLRDGVTVSTTEVADRIKGKQIYLWVYNTTNAGAIASTLEKGLFTSAEWTLPAGFDSAGTTTFNIRLGGNSNGTPATAAVNATAVTGSYSAGNITLANVTNTNGGNYLLSIPEPAAGMLSAFAVAAILLRRRRS